MGSFGKPSLQKCLKLSAAFGQTFHRSSARLTIKRSFANFCDFLEIFCKDFCKRHFANGPILNELLRNCSGKLMFFVLQGFGTSTCTGHTGSVPELLGAFPGCSLGLLLCFPFCATELKIQNNNQILAAQCEIPPPISRNTLSR